MKKYEKPELNLLALEVGMADPIEASVPADDVNDPWASEII